MTMTAFIYYNNTLKIAAATAADDGNFNTCDCFQCSTLNAQCSNERVFNFSFYKCLKCDNKSTLELKFIYIMDKDFRSVLQTRTNTRQHPIRFISKIKKKKTNKNKSSMVDGWWLMALCCVLMCDEVEGKKGSFADNNPKRRKNIQQKQNKPTKVICSMFKFKRWTKGANARKNKQQKF